MREKKGYDKMDNKEICKTQSQILSSILKEASVAQRGLAIFDLDSTLLDVQNRTLQIFKAFVNLKSNQSRFPKAFSVISKTSFLSSYRYFVEDHIRDLGLEALGDVFAIELLKFWKQSFFNNDYLKYDVPYPGALDFLMKLKDCQIKIVYLTGRDETRMGKGTRRSLLDLGFPMDQEHVQLILKPHKSMDDALFKKDVIFEFDKEHYPIWFFENEPFIVNPIIREASHIHVIFFDSVHSNKDHPPSQETPYIKSFKY